MKRGIVNPDLEEERQKCSFDQRELEQFTLQDFAFKFLHDLKDLKEKYPALKPDFSEYEMTREEMIEDYWKKNKLIFEVGFDKYFRHIPE